jgi:SH3-like domain-containing protein
MKKMTGKTGVFLLLLLCLTGAARADGGADTLPLPRFVSISSDEVNLRTGPGLRYPIEWILKKDGMPVEIIREFDAWRQIRDKAGDEGWVHKTLLSGRRTAIINDRIRTLYKKPSKDARPVVRLEPGVVATLDRCEKEWCYLEVAGYEGWLKRDEIWGVYPGEEVK